MTGTEGEGEWDEKREAKAKRKRRGRGRGVRRDSRKVRKCGGERIECGKGAEGC